MRKKMEWIEMCDRAEAAMTELADNQPEIPIGVAFVNDRAEPGWIGRDPSRRIHRLSLGGSWPEDIRCQNTSHLNAPSLD